MTWWGNTTRQKRMRTALQLFTQENHNVKIVQQPLGLDNYAAKLNTEFAGKSAPDWIMMDDNWSAAYAQENALMNLEPMLGKELNLNDVDADLISEGKLGGKLIMAPLAINTFILLYNSTALAQRNVTLPPSEMSWDEFAHFAQSVTKAGTKKTYGTGDESGDITLFKLWLRGKGKDVLKTTTTIGFDAADLVAWWTYWERLRSSGAIPPPDVQASSGGPGSPTNLMVRGTAASVFDWTPQWTNYQGLMTDVVGGHLVPSGPKGTGLFLKGANYYSSPRNSHYGSDAARIADFLINDKRAAKALGVTLGIPASNKIQEFIKPTLTGVEAKSLEYVDVVKQHASPLGQSYPSYYSEMATSFSTNSQSVAFKRETAEKAADKVIKDATKFAAGGK